MIRPLRWPEDVVVVEALAAMCHPTRKRRPWEWWFACPTAVAEDRGRIHGYMSFAVYPSPTSGTILYGMDLGVHPERRGAHLGTDLFRYRLMIGWELDVSLFVGATRPDNEPMVGIFQRFGFEPMGPIIPDYYREETPPTPGQLYWKRGNAASA